MTGEITNLDLAALVEGLERAESLSDPREIAGQALLAVWQFLDGIPAIKKRDLDAPIFNLILAFDDLRKSTRVPMFEGDRSPNRHQAPTARRIMKAYCSFLVDRLLTTNHSLEDASKIVAGALKGSMVLKGHDKDSWKRIKNWRDGASKLESDNQERVLLDALRAEAQDVEGIPAQVVMRIQHLDKKIGRFG